MEGSCVKGCITAVWLCWPLSFSCLEVLPCGAMHCFRVFSLWPGLCCLVQVLPRRMVEAACRGRWVSRCRGWWCRRASRATTRHRPHRRWCIPRIRRRAITPRPHRCITPHLATTLAHPIRITVRISINMGTDMGTTATTMSVAMVGIVAAITAVVEGAHNHALVLVARSASA